MVQAAALPWTGALLDNYAIDLPVVRNGNIGLIPFFLPRPKILSEGLSCFI